MKKWYHVVSYSLVILGVLHTLVTPGFYNTFSLEALWFAGTGLALIVVGFLNIAALKASLPSIWRMCLISNSLCSILLLLIVILLPEVQAFIGLILIIGALAGATIRRRQ